MTREQEIRRTASDFAPMNCEEIMGANSRVGFINGAKWADEHPDLYSITRKVAERARKETINEITDWIKSNLDCYVEVEGEHAFETDLKIHTDLFIEDLKSYMEEQQ